MKIKKKKKPKKNGRPAAILDFLVEICHGLSLCETLHLFYIHGPVILHFLS